MSVFNEIFIPALKIFQKKVDALKNSDKREKKIAEKAKALLNLLKILEKQTLQKLDGKQHIKNRIVSLDDIDARPIKKGKSHPDCEFGTTEEIAFNRQGFMIVVETFIGKPNDAKLYPGTLEKYIERMKGCPETIVTDGGYRSQENINENTPSEASNVFMGRSDDVADEKSDFCRKARAATEGFIAVAKNLRGFGKSLYHRLEGHRIWTLLCQIAWNLKKFLQLYLADEIGEESLIKLSLA